MALKVRVVIASYFWLILLIREYGPEKLFRNCSLRTCINDGLNDVAKIKIG